MRTARVALNCADQLGEGPWWCFREHVLWRVDIHGCTLHRWNPETGEQQSFKFGEPIGCFVPCTDGIHGIAGFQSGLALVDLTNGTVGTHCNPEPDLTENRFNDGKCDREGRLWAGTMDESAEAIPRGSLYRVVSGHDPVLVLSGVITSNGLGWSPDDRVMYYADSGIRTIWRFDFGSDGSLSNRRIFATDHDCVPDGLTVDAEGYVWSAKWDGNRVVRYSPSGGIDLTIEVPTPRPTSVMFGGPELDQLYITSAKAGLTDPDPLAGHLFVAEPGMQGLPETRYDRSPRVQGDL
jgi:sugar lactone lactonase YvrE